MQGVGYASKNFNILVLKHVVWCLQYSGIYNDKCILSQNPYVDLCLQGSGGLHIIRQWNGLDYFTVSWQSFDALSGTWCEDMQHDICMLLEVLAHLLYVLLHRWTHSVRYMQHIRHMAVLWMEPLRMSCWNTIAKYFLKRSDMLDVQSNLL